MCRRCRLFCPPCRELLVPHPLRVGHSDETLYEPGEKPRLHDHVGTATLMIAGVVVSPPHVVFPVVRNIRLGEELAEGPARSGDVPAAATPGASPVPRTTPRIAPVKAASPHRLPTAPRKSALFESLRRQHQLWLSNGYPICKGIVYFSYILVKNIDLLIHDSIVFRTLG